MSDDLKKKSLEWLLEAGDTGVRYLTMRNLMKSDQKELQAAAKMAHADGPIAYVLSKINPEGYWEKPGAGYDPKYTGTVWSVILLSQLGASVMLDKRIETACNYLLEHALTGNGQFTMNGLPSGTIDCLQGNLCAAMLDIGLEDKRIDRAYEWMARSVTGEGVAPMRDKTGTIRYYSGKCGPDFACGGNNKLPCAWGAAKVMLAFSKLPEAKRTPLINKAIQKGVDFLFSADPLKADYPTGYNSKPSGNWWKFGFPVFYVTDILQIAEAIVGLGYGKDSRLTNTINFIKNRQDDKGRWLLEYDYTGKTWGEFGKKKQPNKWVTLRALRILNAAI
jgi:hypothetical protein